MKCPGPAACRSARRQTRMAISGSPISESRTRSPGSIQKLEPWKISRFQTRARQQYIPLWRRRMVRLAHRARPQQIGEMGSQNAEDHRISGGVPSREGRHRVRWIETHGSLRSSWECLVDWISLKPIGPGNGKVYGLLG